MSFAPIRNLSLSLVAAALAHAAGEGVAVAGGLFHQNQPQTAAVFVQSPVQVQTVSVVPVSGFSGVRAFPRARLFAGQPLQVLQASPVQAQTFSLQSVAAPSVSATPGATAAQTPVMYYVV